MSSVNKLRKRNLGTEKLHFDNSMKWCLKQGRLKKEKSTNS